MTSDVDEDEVELVDRCRDIITSFIAITNKTQKHYIIRILYAMVYKSKQFNLPATKLFCDIGYQCGM